MFIVRFPTIVGLSGSLKIFGDEAQSKRPQLQHIHHPVQRGVVADWDSMQPLLQHTFYTELRVAPEEEIFLIVDSPSHTEAHRQKFAQIMIESFEAQTLSFASSAFLVSCTGIPTGVVRFFLSPPYARDYGINLIRLIDSGKR